MAKACLRLKVKMLPMECRAFQFEKKKRPQKQVASFQSIPFNIPSTRRVHLIHIFSSFNLVYLRIWILCVKYSKILRLWLRKTYQGKFLQILRFFCGNMILSNGFADPSTSFQIPLKGRNFWPRWSLKTEFAWTTWWHGVSINQGGCKQSSIMADG